MKGIFLDIDGVINDHYNIRYNRRNGEFQPLDKRMVHMLSVIIDECPDVKIIISSTWRKLYTGEEFIKIFEDAGWSIPKSVLIGSTPSGSGWRGHEIAHWLSTNPLEKFVILDDDLDVHADHADNFMWINPDIGFTMAHMRNIIDYFNGDEKLKPVVYNSAREQRVPESKHIPCTYHGRAQEHYKWE